MCETKYLKKLTFRKIFRKIVSDENDLNYFVIARAKRRQLTVQTFIYYWIYLGARKLFRKRKFDFPVI